MSQTLRRIGRHLRAQWAGLLTILLLLTAGTAYALPGRNTVFSIDIVDGQVTGPDVADGSITTNDVRALSASDIEKNSLGTAQISEPSLGLVPVAGQAGAGVGGSGFCEPSGNYVDCGALGVTLGKPGRLLIIAAVRTETVAFEEGVRGPCRLEVDGAPIEASETQFKYDDEGEWGPWTDPREGAGQQATLTAVSHVYPAGRHLVGVECALWAWNRVERTDVNTYVDISVVGLSDR